MITYLPCELHTHTQHSDGRFSVAGLCRLAKEYEFAAIALTDHNTLSGRHELSPELEAETVAVAVGAEWTTFFGHLLIIGADPDAGWCGDWRSVAPDAIDAGLAAIHAAGGVAGIAHPFAFDTPFCPGCRWGFQVSRWDLVDYIEVWNGHAPIDVPYNRAAYAWWTGLLNQNHRIAATSGCDWHGIRPSVPTAVTYLGIEGEPGTRTVKDALRAGRSFISMGPVMDVRLSIDGRRYDIGQTVPVGKVDLLLSVDETRRRAVWGGYGIAVREFRVIANGTATGGGEIRGGETLTHPLALEPGWMRVELYGDYRKKKRSLLAASSPFYVEEASIHQEHLARGYGEISERR